MNNEKLLSRITVDPKILVGKPTIRGLRISVEQILLSLAAGIDIKSILEEYPDLEWDDIKAVFAYTASLVAEEQIYPVEMKQ